MAFSTQKMFLDIAYANDYRPGMCIKTDGVLARSYAMTIDERAWSLSKWKQAQYLIDLVTCRMYEHADVCQDYRPTPERCAEIRKKLQEEKAAKKAAAKAAAAEKSGGGGGEEGAGEAPAEAAAEEPPADG